MLSVLEYKGYSGIMVLDPETDWYFGTVPGINDVITFQTSDLNTAQQAFQESIDDYLSFCDSLDRVPEIPSL